ncbi:MAG TPA: hypothetical protein VFF84_09010 [Sphingobium sp.]|nr:hypothetical protein [Sphingobium sp.]
MTDNDSDATTLEEAALAQRNKTIESEAKTAKADKQGGAKGILVGSVAAGIGSAALVAALMYAKRRK